MDKAKLLAKREAKTRDVEISDGTVTVRCVTRGEVRAAKDEAKKNTDAEYENLLVSKGMVDPELTSDEVAAWFEHAPAGDSVRVMEAIAELSGLTEGAPKSSVSPVRRRSRR